MWFVFHFCRLTISSALIMLTFVSSASSSSPADPSALKLGSPFVTVRNQGFDSGLLPENPNLYRGTPLSPMACNLQTVSFNQTVNDRLNTGDCGTDHLYDQYQFDGIAGQTINITMFSNAFDAYLELYGPDGQRTAFDAGGAGGSNSRILIGLPTAGAYVIRASSVGSNQTGPYSIRVGNDLTISGLVMLADASPPTPLDNAVITVTNFAGTFSTSTTSGRDGTYVLVLPGIDNYRVTAVRSPYFAAVPEQDFTPLIQSQINNIDFFINPATFTASGLMGVQAPSTAGLRVVISGPSIVTSDCGLNIQGTLNDVSFNCFGLPYSGTFEFTRTSVFGTFFPTAISITSLQGNLQNITFGGPTYIINPIPTILNNSPNAAVAGGQAFALIVTGSNFVTGSVIRWNGQDRSSTFISSTQLTTQIAASDIQSSGIMLVTVFNPSYGGGTSNTLSFSITNPFASVGGKVTGSDGRSVRNAIVSLTDPLGCKRTVTTSSFGFYSFDNVPVGTTYTVSVASKLYRFASQQLQVNGNLANVDFVGSE